MGSHNHQVYRDFAYPAFGAADAPAAAAGFLSGAGHRLSLWRRGPVSYTHLDVYKRQAAASLRCIPSGLRASR
ncbi:hypothetical protein B1A87_017150 [Arthrobacter sp. KBS0703]|uniref:hypothetical protein n=1 Tax=Arthrobacter sp. KBS0703 TaxID=1955698 RepID=UPI00118520B9|nr:hypothetical protein [Arthrobacter sp. KBS0703]TSE17265.1 hypothetical protein B1A87_017150 [Arthrobacter sp. KBS0703]